MCDVASRRCLDCVGGKAARDELWTAPEGIGVFKCKSSKWSRACKAVGQRCARLSMHVRKHLNIWLEG